MDYHESVPVTAMHLLLGNQNDLRMRNMRLLYQPEECVATKPVEDEFKRKKTARKTKK